MNWDLLNDGIGNPKNVRTILKVHETASSMSLGALESHGVAVEKGFQVIEYRQAARDEVDAVIAYVASLEVEESPHLVAAANGTRTLSDRAKQGKRLFEDGKVGCAECHHGRLLTDRKQYDVGTGEPADGNAKIDNPALVELWRTAQYLHDGRSATLQEVLTRFNAGDRHGTTLHLSQEEVEQLVEYLLSL